MKVSGQYSLNAPREQVWEAINDIDVLARIVPGCQRLEQTGDHEYEGTLKIGIQAIKGVYNGKIQLTDIQPPHHYQLAMHGKGANGVVDGTGAVDLEEEGDGKTLLKYAGDAKIGGTLASVGQRLIEGTARQLINQSLKALEEKIAERAAATASPSDTHADAEPSAQPEKQASPPAASEAATPVALPSSTAAPSSPAASTSAAPTATSTPVRRTVIVPEHEQLSPESVLGGLVQDFVKDRAGIAIALLMFVIGYLFGRNSRD